MERKYFVSEGDWGGQIYLTAPVGSVKVARLVAVTVIADVLEWPCNDGDGINVYEWDAEPGDIAWGGMGGGLFTGGFWLYPKLHPGLKAWILDFLTGKTELPSVQTMWQWFVQDRWYFGQKLWKKLDGARRRAAGLLREEGSCVKK